MKTHGITKFGQFALALALFTALSLSGTPGAVAQEQEPAPTEPPKAPPALEVKDAEEQKPPAPTDPDTSEPQQQAPKPKIDGQSVIREKMRIFRAYEGEWEGVQSYAQAEGNAAFESKSGWTGSYQLDGMYFEMDGFSDYPSGRSSYRWMITYDAVLEKYRAWTFNSNGIVTDWIAHHDAEQKEIVWRFVDPRTGIRGWLRTQTPKPNVVTGHGMAKNEGSRVLSDYRLDFKRKKLRI